MIKNISNKFEKPKSTIFVIADYYKRIIKHF